MKGMRICIYIISGIMIMATQIACVSPMGMTSSTTPLEGKQMKILGKSTGYSNWSGAIFGLWSVNRPDIEMGIQDALKMEKRVTIVREEEQKDLYLKKGAVLSLKNGATIAVDKNMIKQLCGENTQKEGTNLFKSENSLVFKEGKLFLIEKDKEEALPPCGIIETGCGVELRYQTIEKQGQAETGPQQPVSVLVHIVKGDIIAYIDGRPGRIKEDEALEMQDGSVLSKVEGDALINVRWYERTYFFVFFSLHRVMVSGDIALFEKEKEVSSVSDEKNKDAEKTIQQTPVKSRRKSR